ncbi:MAG TPA: hypothetical protein PKU95_04830 [Candidatus Dojkabacteria bacterium]|nr:hypothetical protein [Candidatus Dojkabacteria bacterium]
MENTQNMEVSKDKAKKVITIKVSSTFLVLFLLFIIAISLIAVIYSVLGPNYSYGNITANDQNADVKFDIELKSAKQFIIDDNKRILLNFKFINGNNWDFWFSSTDMLLHTGELFNYAGSNKLLNPQVMYKVPARGELEVEFAWDMPSIVEPLQVNFTNSKKYFYSVNINDIETIEAPAALISLNDQTPGKNDPGTIDKTDTEYESLINNIKAFLNGDKASMKKVNIDEAKITLNLPFYSTAKWYDYSDDDYDYYSYYFQLGLDQVTLSPKEELIKGKNIEVDYDIYSQSELSKFSDEFTIIYDGFPNSGPVGNEYGIDVYSENKVIGNKNVRVVNMFYRNYYGNDVVENYYIFNLNNGHAVTIEYVDVVKDSILREEDKALRFLIVEKIIEQLSVF